MKAPIQILLLAAVYALAGKLGMRMAFVNAGATAVWPSAGIALAALLILGYRVWPGVLMGAFIVHLATTGTIAASLGVAIGRSLESLCAAYLVNRFARGRDAFDRPSDIFKYAVLAAMISPVVGATVGVLSITLGGSAIWADFWPIWQTWWVGDAEGIMIVAPLLVLWSAKPGVGWTRNKTAEAGLVFLGLAFLGAMVVGGLIPAKITHYPLEYICTPVVIWAAFSLGQRETATIPFLLSLLLGWGTLHGYGPFYSAQPNDSLLLLQAYMGVVSIMSLAVSAVVSERRRAHEDAEKELESSQTRLHRLMESNVIGIISVDERGTIMEANEAFLKMIGCRRDEMQRGTLNTHALTPLEYQAQEEWAVEQLRTRGACPALEKEFIHRAGNRIPVIVGGVQLDQAPARAIYFVIDATHRRQAMDALRKAYDEIEIRVQERTQELSEVNRELSKEVARRKQAEDELRNLTLLDPLTGLYNRRGFLALADQQWLQAIRDKRSFHVFFADVDGLKRINDTLGHSRGDQVLIEAAEALRGTFRKSDILARIGGDEFAVVATQMPLEQPQAYLTRLQEYLEKVNAAGRFPFELSLSIGVATSDPNEETSVEELMRQADTDLYNQKHSRAPSNRP